MSDPDHRANLVLLRDFKPSAKPEEQLQDLRRQLEALPDFAQVQLQPNSNSTVIASVPSRNQNDTERLKALVDEKVSGWRIIDGGGYRLPNTF